MRLEIKDDLLHIDNKDTSLLQKKDVRAQYINDPYDSTHYDFDNSKCKYYAYFHNQIRSFNVINPDDFLENLYLDCFNFEEEKDTLYGLYKKDDILYASLMFQIDYTKWDESFSLKEFLLEMRKIRKFGIYSVEMTYSLLVFITVNVKEPKLQIDIVREIETKYNLLTESIISSKVINNTISFSPEHLTAGSSILQYFGKLLQEKYPNEKVSVSIKQEDLKVTMIVETPDGKKEEIEEYLNRYGLVITNEITPQEFTSNPIQILELETKLEQAKMEIGFQKKLLALKDKTYDENLVSLKDEVKFLRTELSSIQTNNNEQIKLLLSSLLSKDKLIKKLTKSIDKKDELETKQLLLELKDKDNNGYIGLKQHLDNAIIGGIVNAPSWIQFTMGIITKL